jgi:hypothetical protein
MMTMAAVHERVVTMVPQQHQSPFACTTTSTATARKRVEAMAPWHYQSSPACVMMMTAVADPETAPRYYDHVLLMQQQRRCQCGQWRLLIVACPLLTQTKGSMVRGNATASRRIAGGGGMRRADARRRRHDERQRRNQ